MTTPKSIRQLDPHPAGSVSNASVVEIHRQTSTKSEQITVQQLLQNVVGPVGATGPAGPQGPQGDPGSGILVQGEASVATINTWDPGAITTSYAWVVTDAGTLTVGTPSTVVTAGDMVVWTDGDYFINVGPVTGGAKSTQTDETGGAGAYGTLAGAVDSVNQVFVTSVPYKANSLRVVWHGVIQSGNNVTETTPSTGTFTLGFAPTTGTWVQAIYEPV